MTLLPEKAPEELPEQIAEGTLDFGGIPLRVAVLNNGQRVILKEDFDKYVRPFLDELGKVETGDENLMKVINPHD